MKKRTKQNCFQVEHGSVDTNNEMKNECHTHSVIDSSTDVIVPPHLLQITFHG